MYNYITFWNYEFGNFTILWVFAHLENKSKIIKLKFTFNLGHIDALLFGGIVRKICWQWREKETERQRQREWMCWRAKQEIYDKRGGGTCEVHFMILTAFLLCEIWDNMYSSSEIKRQNICPPLYCQVGDELPVRTLNFLPL